MRPILEYANSVWFHYTDKLQAHFLYKGLKGRATINTDHLIAKTGRYRNQHSLAFQVPSASKDVYKYSFFPQIIRDWSDPHESLISSSKLSDDSVSSSLILRARD